MSDKQLQCHWKDHHLKCHWKDLDTGFAWLWLYLVQHLRFPHPLTLRVTRLPKRRDGDCTLKNGKFDIRINRVLPVNQAIDAMLHELAHALSLEKDADAHGPAWGIAYSRVYRSFLQ